MAAGGDSIAAAYVARAGRLVLVDGLPEGVDVKDISALLEAELTALEVRYDLPDGQMRIRSDGSQRKCLRLRRIRDVCDAC